MSITAREAGEKMVKSERGLIKESIMGTGDQRPYHPDGTSMVNFVLRFNATLESRCWCCLKRLT
jgi:hypothetical protein